jgi:chromosome segregation ATPase
MANDKSQASELMAAAEAFDEHLARFARLAETARQGRLNSQKNLQRAARAFQESGEAEKRLGLAAQELVAALNAARRTQETQAQAIQERAQEIASRTAVAADLLKRYGAIGGKAAELNALVLDLATKKSDGAAGGGDVLPVLAQVRARLAEVLEGALELVTAANEADFEDIAGEARSLREQVAAADVKIAAIERSLVARSS